MPAIADLIDPYLAAIRRRGLAAATLRAYAVDLRAAAAAFPQPITDLTTDLLDRWLATTASQDRRRAALRGFFAWCLAQGLSPHDPARALPGRRRPRRLPRPITSDADRRSINDAIRHAPMPYRLIFTLLRETGMRVGEVLHLNVGDVRLDPGREGLHVRDPKNRIDRIVVLGPSSTPRSLRLLRQHLAAIGADRLPATHPLCCSNRATRVGYSTVRHQWARLCRRAGLLTPDHQPRYTLHHLRHTAATELLEQGVDLSVIQRRMGHTDIRTTMGYAALTDDAVRTALEAAARRR